MQHFETEEQFEDYLFEKLFLNDFEVYRQVPSDETIDWENPYRLDLMFRRGDILNNEWIGMELKLSNDMARGAKVFEAIKQIKRYNTYNFKSSRIKYWVFATPSDCLYEAENLQFAHRRTREFVQHFLSKCGIGFLNNNNIINFCSNNSRGIIRIYDPYKINNEVSIDYINKITEELNKIQFL